MNTLAIEQYPVLSLRFLKAYIITMRPYLMFVSGVTGIVGMSFAADMDSVKTLLIFIASFLSYGFGQALTDCFQIDTDSISSPYRPLTQGIVNRNYFLVISCLRIAVLHFDINLFQSIKHFAGCSFRNRTCNLYLFQTESGGLVLFIIPGLCLFFL